MSDGLFKKHSREQDDEKTNKPNKPGDKPSHEPDTGSGPGDTEHEKPSDNDDPGQSGPGGMAAKGASEKASQSGTPQVTAEQAFKDTGDKPTFEGKPTTPVPDMKPSIGVPNWLLNTLVCDQNKKDFVYLQENAGAYNGLSWQAICLKCGWQTYQPDKSAALDYLLNYHLVQHIRNGARPGPVLVGTIAETMAPSGIPAGPQPPPGGPTKQQQPQQAGQRQA